MSTTEPTSETAAPATTAKPSRRTIPIVAGAALAGLALGGFVLGPKMVSKGASAEAKPAHAGKEEHAERRMVRVDNLVVNPAGSEGLRFLMVSVAFEVTDPNAETQLRDAEVQIRDLVTGVFERQTLAGLTRPGARDSLRLHLAEVVRPIIGAAPVRVFLPQFVIQ